MPGFTQAVCPRSATVLQAAKAKTPCIIFIDEIDAVGSNRRSWENHSRKTLNQMLTEMDGFEENSGVIVMAATNLPEVLDPALTRPGRFDRRITINVPDIKGRTVRSSPSPSPLMHSDVVLVPSACACEWRMPSGRGWQARRGERGAT